jgi:tripartite-type tricarboxylate transporter receptor subunit TctC
MHKILFVIKYLYMTGLGAAGCLVTAVQAAQTAYPVRPLRIVNGFPPGGNTDIIARAIAQKLTERLGQQVIVENRPGAGSMIGTDYVAKATPDGYTLLLVSGAVTTQTAVLKTLPFDPLRDFAWISNAVSYPFAVIVKPDAPMQSIADLIAAAKKAPGKLNYASVGIGSVLHLAAELFNASANVEMTHIPYKGGAEPMLELVSGRVDVVFDPVTSSYPHLQSGRIRALAVTSLERSPQLPNLPTVAQTLPGFEVTSFSGFAAPRGTPAERVARLNREIHAALAEPDIRKRFIDMGGTLMPSSPEAFGRHVAAEIAKWKKIAAAKKIEIQ